MPPLFFSGVNTTQSLIDAGANLDFQAGTDGWTALMNAAGKDTLKSQNAH